MARSSREETLPDSLADCKLKGSQRKPPRHVAAAAGHGVNPMGVSKDHPAESNGGAGGKLTTFQKLDREMGKFVASQPNFQKVVQVRDSSGNLLQQGSEEDSGSRGVRHGVKMWKCGWMFEQDSLYWDTVRRQNVSGDDQETSLSKPPLKTVKEKDGDNMAGGTMSSTSSEDHQPPQPLLCSTDYEAATYSGMELHLRKSSSSVGKSRSRLRDSSSTCGGKSIPRSSEKEGSWPAVLKAKCELLQVEKDLANQRWRQQCAEMAQAAEMAHCLRASVQTILETAKRGTVSAPCTPARLSEADHLSLLHRVQHQLQASGGSGQHDRLEDQAETFQKRIEKLRQKSQVRSSADPAASFQHNDVVETKSRPSSTSNSAQSIMTKAEEWAQVHEVLRRLSNQTASLKESCQSWEKRAMSAESKAATLQVEEERWRVEVQKSEDKIKELEKELTVVRATMEEVKNRHALEQSRLVGSCGSHGYTLVLKPFLQTASFDHSGLGTDQCRCNVSSDFGSCVLCGGINACASSDHQRVNQIATNSNSCPASYLSRETTGGDDTSDQTCTADGEPAASHINPAAKSSPQGLTTSSSRATSSTSPSPRRTVSRNNSGTIRHRYEWSNSIRDVSPRVPIKASADKKTAGARGDEPAGRSSELERSLSQRWIKQRPKTTRLATDQAILLDAPVINSGGTPRLSTKLQSDIGSKVVSKGPSPLRKPGQLSTGSSCRVPSPSPVDKPRTPLKEMKRNTSITKS